MHYIPSYTPTNKGIDINKKWLVTEKGDAVVQFTHGTPKGYQSQKPIIIDFEYTINEYNEVAISDEIAAILIEQYSGKEYKFFETAQQKESGRKMAGMIAWASYMGDHGDTSGKFSHY